MANRLYHHGILGQKWGVRNGPPYPLKGGSFSKSEKEAIYEKRKTSKNSIYNKKHFDEVIKEGTTLNTLSYSKDRTKDTDMFFASYKTLDKHQYNAMFNKKKPQPVFDEDGNEIGVDSFWKYRIKNKLASNVKVASEDSGARIFAELYEKDRNFYNFVTDENRMSKYFLDNRYKFKGYREAKNALDKIKDGEYVPTEEDVKKVYRMFNYVIPYDGGGNDSLGAKDVLTQRTKFFNTCKKEGYGAILDTNDAIYGGFKASSPIIMFDMDQVIPDSVRRTNAIEIGASSFVTSGRKALGI